MRILFIHGERREPGQAGGAESLLRDQAEGLKRLGHETAWWYGQGRLEDALDTFKPDVCHLMTLHCYPMGLDPAIYLQRNGIPHIWHVQDYWPFCANRMMVIGDRSCSGVHEICRNECGGYAHPEFLEVANGSFIVAGNENTAKIYRRNGLRCDAVVELGVDVDLFKQGVKDEPPSIYASCSILAGSWKGMHILKRALDGTPYKAKLLTGLPREQVAQELAHASIFVFPSCYEETFGLSLCEAMASGCACITSDNAGGLAQVEDMETGLVTRKCDADMLKDAIEDLVTNGTLRKRLGDNAREHVEEHHSLEAMAGRWVTAYQQAMA
mgnify:CR=1 FL=1